MRRVLGVVTERTRSQWLFNRFVIGRDLAVWISSVSAGPAVSRP
jgi:hypothetical protein